MVEGLLEDGGEKEVTRLRKLRLQRHRWEHIFSSSQSVVTELDKGTKLAIAHNQQRNGADQFRWCGNNYSKGTIAFTVV